MFEIIQTVVKDVTDGDEILSLSQNFLKFGWTEKQVHALCETGKMEREGKLSDGQRLYESVEIKSKLMVVGK